MLKRLNVDQARFIATLAKVARAQRDEFLGNVPEDDLNGSTSGRGEHNPTAELGFEALPHLLEWLPASRDTGNNGLDEYAGYFQKGGDAARVVVGAGAPDHRIVGLRRKHLP